MTATSKLSPLAVSLFIAESTALTTTGSCGSLAFSDHIGIRSLGILLTAGMVLTVVCNLIVLPALLDLRRRGAPAVSEQVPSPEATGGVAGWPR